MKAKELGKKAGGAAGLPRGCGKRSPGKVEKTKSIAEGDPEQGGGN